MMKNYIKKPVTILSALILAGCSMSYKIIRDEPVKNIPDKKYETIIRLNTPDSEPLEPEAGYVYVEPGGKVKTDFAREEVVQHIDMLNKYKLFNKNNMGKFIIKDSKGKVRGYYEIRPEYRTIIWESGDDILLQIIIPYNMMNSIGDGRDNSGKSGGHHGGR
ncbi:MAG: hypothetical protein WA096_11145 [Smithella sp.]